MGLLNVPDGEAVRFLYFLNGRSPEWKGLFLPVAAYCSLDKKRTGGVK